MAIMEADYRMRSSKVGRTVFVLGALVVLALECPAAELYLRASGGLIRSRFGDIDQALRDWSASWEAFVARLPGWGFEQTGTLRQSGCTSFGAEIMAKFGGRWAVGLGFGLLYSNFVDLAAPLYVENPAAKIEYMSPTKIAAYPFYAFGQYAFPLGKTWAAYLTGGMGFVRAKYVHREKFRDINAVNPGVSLSEIASAGGALLLAGLGVQYAVDAALSLFAEAGAVLSKVSPFEEDVEAETKGLLYYYQEYDATLDFWQTKLRLQAEEPAGFTFRAVRKANIDLGGLSLRAGLMMKF